MEILEINQQKLSLLDVKQLQAFIDIFKAVSNSKARRIVKDLSFELHNRKNEEVSEASIKDIIKSVKASAKKIGGLINTVMDDKGFQDAYAKYVDNPNDKNRLKKIQAYTNGLLGDGTSESVQVKESRLKKVCSIILGKDFDHDFIYEDVDFTKPSSIKDAYKSFALKETVNENRAVVYNPKGIKRFIKQAEKKFPQYKGEIEQLEDDEIIFPDDEKLKKFFKGAREVKFVLNDSVDHRKLKTSNKLSSAEYEKFGKLKAFNDKDWKWNSKEGLYHRVNEETDLKEASASDIKKVLAAAKKAGGTVKGNQIDFGMGAVIDVSVEKGKIKLDAGLSNGVEYFKNAKDAIMAFESVELEEAFSRLPGNIINNELYTVEKDLKAFVSSQRNGNDVNEKQLNNIIKDLQSIKKEIKKFNKPEDVPVSYQYKESADLEEAKNITVRSLRQMMFRIDSSAADKFRRELFKVDAQDSPASNAQIKQGKKIAGNKFGEKEFQESTDLEEAKNDTQKDIESLKKMIKNPDPKRVKSYGGTKYVDMLKSKLAKLQESTDLETTNTLTQDEYDEVQNFRNFKERDWKYDKKTKTYIRKNKV